MSIETTVPVYPFKVPPLRFDYAALEPYIDAQTMRLHHDKHHQTYVDTLNNAIKDQPQLHGISVEDIMRRLHTDVPETIRTTVRNHGGGHANHQFLWKILGPGHTVPSGAIADAIEDEFNGFDNFKKAFADAAARVFGSGWAFLVVDPKNGGRLKIHTTANQDSVLLDGLPGLMCCDVWEHAYYLKYQNRRADYLAAYWNVVDWEVVGHRLDGIRAGKKQL